MKITTFNLRVATHYDGMNYFFHRVGTILRKIEAELPDVIGFQECAPDMFDFLSAHLNGYQLVGCGRGEQYDGEHNPVAFRTDKYELIGLSTEWLSPTPQIPGSRYPEQSDCPRIVTCLTLLDRTTAKPFYVWNTHLDHISDLARVLGARQVCRLLKDQLEKRDLPVALLGDFNAEPDSEPLKVFLEESGLGLIDRTAGIPCTFHAFGQRDWQHIDYILTRGFDMEGAPELWTDEDSGLYLSDHYPITVFLNREK